MADTRDCGPPPPLPNAVQASHGNKYTANYTCVAGYQSKSGGTVETISCYRKWRTPAAGICEGSYISFLLSFLIPSLRDKRYGAIAGHFISLQHSINLHQSSVPHTNIKRISRNTHSKGLATSFSIGG